jgi:hypothetical protein
VILLFLGKARNNLLFLNLQPKQNIVLWHLLPNRLFCYVGYLHIWESLFLILLLCIVATRVLFILFTTWFFKNELGTLNVILVVVWYCSCGSHKYWCLVKLKTKFCVGGTHQKLRLCLKFSKSTIYVLCKQQLLHCSREQWRCREWINSLCTLHDIVWIIQIAPQAMQSITCFQASKPVKLRVDNW